MRVNEDDRDTGAVKNGREEQDVLLQTDVMGNCSHHKQRPSRSSISQKNYSIQNLTDKYLFT